MTQTAISAITEESIRARNESGEQTDLRMEAFTKFQSLEIPGKDQEAWRKVNLKGFDPRKFSPLQSNSTLDAKLEDGSGIELLSIDDALMRPDLRAKIEKRFQDIIHDKNCNIFRAMNLAAYNNSCVIVAGKGSSGRVRITHSSLSSDSVAHLLFIFQETNSDLLVIEEYKGTSADDYVLWTPATEVFMEENAHLKYVSHRLFTDSEQHFITFLSEQNKNSTIHNYPIHMGGANGKGFIVSRLLEQGTEFFVKGLGVGRGREFHDLEFHAEHFASNSISNILYKTVLKDKAHSIFDGYLEIPKGVKNIDSLQVNRNILLDKTARAESMPRLVTKSESVQCEHGATVGDLDPEAIFFLMARGISEDDAKSLLIQGFVSEVVETLPINDEEKEAMDRALQEAIRA